MALSLGSTCCNAVFVDTSLDTHIFMLVSKSETVSDFKKKIMSYHVKCFPNMKIQIRSLKVKHGEIFYCLPDDVLVWDAFHHEKGDWVVTVDAASKNRTFW